jgi:hypothetical protein
LRCHFLVLAIWLFVCATVVPVAQAALQFDVFLGYDGLVPEATWFPIVCEIKNDGPSFNGVVEVTPGTYNQGQTRQAIVELPTGTLKRLVIPVFSTTARGFSSWDVRLLDERGKVRSEQSGLRPRRQMASEAPLIGALPRTANGAPTVKPILASQPELQPLSARISPSIFPDNPLVLEGMSALYLNSEKASELRVTQVNALFAWLNAGGHLIVGVEQVSDVNSIPWLKNLFPCELKDLKTVKSHPELQAWLRTASGPTNFTYSVNAQPLQYNYGGRNRPGPRPNVVNASGNPFGELADDMAFEAAEMQVAVGTLRDGHVVAGTPEAPLVVAANRGRGRITALLFSPEREPARSWKNLPTFWAKLAEVPAVWYISSDFSRFGGWSSDGIFGAMIDTRQVHKLPIEWLLLLLIVYLVVIGPLDQFWLKRIGKPMLTWITFPCYVVLFSLLIYFIGYKLRAGESEWNELHLVDVLLNDDKAELRGRTYASVYSPSNQKYKLKSDQKYATLRAEFLGTWGAGQSGEKASVMQEGDSFRAEIFVPVWTSQLFVSDWWQSAAVPLNVSVAPDGAGWQVKVQNNTDRKLTNTQVAIEGSIMPLGDLDPNQARTFKVNKGQGMPLREFAFRDGERFLNAVQGRQRAFGASAGGQIEDLPNSSIAASFISQLSQQNAGMNFVAPPGLDLSHVLEHGNAIVFAWAQDYSPVKPITQFSPKRVHRETLWRVAAPVIPVKPEA